MADLNKGIASVFGESEKKDILGTEQIDPKTGLTQDPGVFGDSRFPGTTVTRGRIPKAYTRILGEEGYHPEFGYKRTQEKLAEEQTSFGQFANFLNQAIVGEVIGGSLEGIGYLGKVLDVGSMVSGTEQDWGNLLSDVGRDLKTWAREAAPIYVSPDAPKFNPGDWAWWMSHGPSVASTLSLMLPAAGVVRGIGAAGKLLKLGKGLGATAEWMLTGIGQATVSRHMENMMEASGVYEEAYESAKSAAMKEYAAQANAEIAKLPLSMPWDPENPGAYTEEQKQADIAKIQNKYMMMANDSAKREAAIAASNTYKKQWALMVQDIPQYLLLNRLGGMGKGVAKESADVMRRMGMDPLNTYAKKGVAVLKDMTGEFGEEIYQFAVNEQSKNLMRSANDPAIKNSVTDVLRDNFNNGEMWTAGVFGALGAGVMQAGFAGLNAKAIRKSNEARIKNIDKFGPTFNHAAQVVNEAVEEGDPRKVDIALDNALVPMVLSAEENGNLPYLKQFAQAMKDPNDDTLERFNISEKTEKFMAENPDFADRIIENIDQISALHERFIQEGRQSPNVAEKDIGKFASAMTMNSYFVDRASKRVENAESRIEQIAQEGIRGYSEMSQQGQLLKRKQLEVHGYTDKEGNKVPGAIESAINKMKSKFEKAGDDMSELEKATAEEIIADSELRLERAKEEYDKALEDYKKMSEETRNEDSAISNALIDEDLKNYLSELEAIELTKDAIVEAKAEIKEFREGRGYKATPEEEADYEEATRVEDLKGITVGDKVGYVDENGEERAGEVDNITVEEAEDGSTDTRLIVQPLNEDAKPEGDIVVLGGESVTLLAPKETGVDGNETSEGLSFEDEDALGIVSFTARSVEKARGSKNPISNLSYSHVNEDDPRVVDVRNDKFNKTISDPNLDMSKARAYYELDNTAIDDYVETLESTKKTLKKEIERLDKEEDKKPKRDRIKKVEEKIALANKMKDISKLTSSDINKIITTTSGDIFDDIVDNIRIAVRMNVGGTSYTKGLMLHTSGYDKMALPTNLKTPETTEAEITNYMLTRKRKARVARVVILRALLKGEKPFTDNLSRGRGVPLTIDKNLSKAERERDPITTLGIEDPEAIEIGIAQPWTKRKGGYYKPNLKVSAKDTRPRPRDAIGTGGTYIFTDKTINGDMYAFKLNKKNLAREHAELLYDAFVQLARSNAVWNEKKQAYVPISGASEEKVQRGIIGRYDYNFMNTGEEYGEPDKKGRRKRKPDPRVSGLSIGEYIDLVVTHGERLTDPDSGRYYQSKDNLNKQHLDVLRNKRLYIAVSPDNDMLPSLIFGNKEDGKPYQVNLINDRELKDYREIFVEWAMKNKTYPHQIVNKMLGQEVNGPLLRGKEFRIGTKGSATEINQKEGDGYNTILLKHFATVDTEVGEYGTVFHAPTIDLGIEVNRDKSGKWYTSIKTENSSLKKDTKPEIDIEDEVIKKHLETEDQKEESKAKKVVEPKTEMAYENQFNSGKKRMLTAFYKDRKGESKVIEIIGDEYYDVMATISEDIENQISEGKDPKAIVKAVTNYVNYGEFGATLFVIGGRGANKNKSLETFIEQRFAGLTNRTLYDEFDYGETLKNGEPGEGFAPTDVLNKPVTDRVPDGIEEDIEKPAVVPPETEEEDKVPEDEKEGADAPPPSLDDLMKSKYGGESDLIGRPYNRPSDFTEQQLLKELDWFTSRVNKKREIKVKVTKQLGELVRHGRANWALYSHAAITLYEAAEEGTIYHEAFHRVSLAYLSKAERERLYRQARQVYKMPERKFSDREVEERLAEEFREYVLVREKQNKPGFIRRIFDELINWIRSLFIDSTRLTYSEIDTLFSDIYRGKFRYSTLATENIGNLIGGEYQKVINGQDFTSFINRKQVNDMAKKLGTRLLELNNVGDLNSVGSNLKGNIWKPLIADLEDTIQALDQIIENKNTSETDRSDAEIIRLQHKEILGEKDEFGNYSKFPTFMEKIEDYFNMLGIRNKFQNNNEETDEGYTDDAVSKFDTTIGKSSYQVARKDNALTSIKWRISTLHQSEEIDPITKFQPYVDFNETWHQLLFDLHDLNTIDEMIDVIEYHAEERNSYSYKQLAKYLKKGSENFRAQFLNTFRLHRHEFINFFFNYKGIERGAIFTIIQADYNQLSRQTTLIWGENLWSDDLISTIGEEGTREANENFFDRLGERHEKLANSLDGHIENNTVTEEIEDEVFDEMVSMLGEIHIALDRRTLESYIDNNFNNESTEQGLNSMVKEVGKLFVEKTMDNNLINNPIALDLGKAYATAHPEKATDMTSGPNNNKYYNFSLHNLATDVTNKIHNDRMWSEEKRNRLGNKNSIMLNNFAPIEGSSPEVQQEATERRKNFKLLTFSKAQQTGTFDLGRAFTNISELENYLIKQSAIFQGLLPFPVMANRKTYFFMQGGVDPLSHVIESSTDDNRVRFNKEVVDIFYGYYKDESERIKENKKLIKEFEETKDENRKEILRRRLIKNYHYTGDYNTSNANSVNFIHFKGFNLNMSKSDFGKKLQDVLNDRMQEEIDYAARIGVISRIKKTGQLGRLAVAAGYVSDFEKEDMPPNHGVLHMLAHNLINTQIAVIEAEKVFIGDPAMFKRTNNTDVDVFEDLYKRWHGIGASGSKFAEEIANEGPNFSVVTFKDPIFKSDLYDVILEKHIDLYKDFMRPKKENQKLTDEELTTKATKLAEARLKAYTKIDPTDGQMWITPKYYRSMMMRLGLWSKDKQRAYTLLTSTKKLTPEQELTAQNIVLQPQKTVYMGHHNHDNIDLLIYDKMSMATIFRRNVEGTHLEEVLDRMEAKGKYKGLAPVDAIKFESAVKAGGLRAHDMYTDPQNRTKIADLSDVNIYTQSFENLRHQVTTDVHEAGYQSFGTQAYKSLTSNIQKDKDYGEFTSGQDLLNAITRSRMALSDIGTDKVKSKLGFKDGRISNQRLIRMLINDAKMAGKSDDFRQSLDIDKNTGELFLELDSFPDRRWVYDRLTAIVTKNTIDLNLPGNQLIQVTDYGMSGRKDDVRTVKELGFSYSKKGSKEIYTMEARVSERLFKKFIPNFDKLSRKKRLELVNSNLEVLGYRIPTQGQNSIVKLKIVDLLPEQSGDVIHLPLEFTALTGSDFDIDKLFVNTYNYKYDRKNNRLEKVKFNDSMTEDAIRQRYVEKTVEMYSIYKNHKELFDTELYNKLRELENEGKSLKNFKKEGAYAEKVDSDSVEEYKTANLMAKLEFIKNKLETVTDPVKLKKWQELDASTREELEYYQENGLGSWIVDLNNTIEKQNAKEIASLTQKILIDAGVLPKYQVFKDLTIEEQNTASANQNRLLDIFFTVLEDEKHYLATSTPLGAYTGILKKKAQRNSAAALGQKDLKGNYRSLPALKMGTPTFQAQTKATYVGSDVGIGPSALANAHHALAQQAGLKIKSKLGFRFNTNNVLSLDRHTGEDGVYISDWLSSLIDAYVDAVKDPYIMDLNVNEATLNEAVFMLRVGVGEPTFDFMSQPILKHYALEFQNEVGQISPTNRKAIDIVREIWEDRYTDAGGKEEDLNDSSFLMPMTEVLNVGKLISDIQGETKDKEYYRRQLNVLLKFEAIKEDANKLKELVMASRIDTKKFGSNPSQHNIFISKLRAIEENKNFINLEKLVTSDGHHVEGATMLPHLYKNSVLFLKDLMARRSIYGSNGFNQILFNELLYSTKAGNGASAGTINTLTEELMSFFFGQFFADPDVGAGMTTKKLGTILYSTKHSVFSQIDDINRGKHEFSEELKQNPFIKALILDYSRDEDVLVKSSLKMPYHTLNELWEKDDYIEAFGEIINHSEQKVRDLGRLLYLYSFYTSGFRKRKFSLESYVPTGTAREILVKNPRKVSEQKIIGLNQFVKQLLVELNDPSMALKYAKAAKREVFSNNWWDQRLVPRVAANDVKTEIEDDTDEVIGYELDLKPKSKQYLGLNKDKQHVYVPYLLLEASEDETVLLEYAGYNDDNLTPVYRIVAKKGFQAKGLVLKEYGLKNLDSKFKFQSDRSVIPENNDTPYYSENQFLSYAKKAIKPYNSVIFDNQFVTNRNPIRNFFGEDLANEMRKIETEGVKEDRLNVSIEAAKGYDHQVELIISGIQTGIDEDGLDVAVEKGIKTGGFAPYDFRQEGKKFVEGKATKLGLKPVTEDQLNDWKRRHPKPPYQEDWLYEIRAAYNSRTELNVKAADATVYFATPITEEEQDKGGLDATRYYAAKNRKDFFIYIPEGETYDSYGVGFSTAAELRQLLINKEVKVLNVAGNRASKLSKEYRTKFNLMLRQALDDKDENTIETLEKATLTDQGNTISSPSRKIEIFVDGSVVPITPLPGETGLVYGYGAWTDFNGKDSRISGGTAEVKELLFKEFPEVEGQKQASPSVELLGTWQALEPFRNTKEHIEILQDNSGIVNYVGLRERSVVNEGNTKDGELITAWGEKNPLKPHIKYIVDKIVNVVEQIEKNGGSVTFRWIPGHITPSKAEKYKKAFSDINGIPSNALYKKYKDGNDIADTIAEEIKTETTGWFADIPKAEIDLLDDVKNSKQDTDEGDDIVENCKTK